MKIAVQIARFLVGALFIFSGFIKLNDPLGFSYKLQEYFAPEVLNLEFLSPYALLISIILVIAEVVLGIALIIGYGKKIPVWFIPFLPRILRLLGFKNVRINSTLLLLLLMIIFFTFLTFYSAYFNKVTDCGCFGDAIPLVPWESFIKDVILLVLILFLLAFQKYIQPVFKNKIVQNSIIFLSFAACMCFGYYVLMHLPWLDFRAYKEGSNITKNMEIPEGAPEAIFEYHWKFNVNGKEEIVTTSGGYPQVEGEFVGYETEQVQEGYIPPVHDFTIEKGDDNFTTTFLEKENLIAIVAYNIDKTEREGYYNIRKVTEEAIRKGYTVIGLTSSSPSVHEPFVRDYKLPFEFYYTDETTLKTIVRASPGIVSLDKGTILQKLHYNDAEDLILNSLPTAKPHLNFILKYQLDSIAVLDQKYRKLMQVAEGPERKALGESLGLDHAEYSGDLWKRQIALDTSNLRKIESILKAGIYPGKSLVGTPTNIAAWSVIQHSNKIPEYLDLMKKAGKAGELPFRLVAMMEDRYLMNEGKHQIYGTQGMTYHNGEPFIWPIENPEEVNKRREEAGFNSTIEVYAKNLFGEDFEYKNITLEEAEVKRLASIKDQE
ncbi:BT_3928 family protein [uncultured Dokdonia sp.]|uniref:BT_3928 family protein n=1 Tax=uncultured Dokdonia sp. TaxID=575653 RepID=UPI0026253E92|nr:BT_3928 family protein [uncultured Dokdonia sp.]